MNEQDLNNVGLLCKEHGPKAMKEPPDLSSKIGWFVKIPLKISDEVRKEYPIENEHVWIKVVWTDGESVEGVINNHPIYADEEFGDTVVVPVSHIEDICEPEPPHAS